MKQVKVYKIVLSLATVLLFALSCLTLLSFKTVNAVDIEYFTGTYTDAVLENNSAVFNVGNKKTVELSNSMVANDLSFGLKVGDDIDSFTLTFETEPNDVNGNVDSQDTLFDTVKHTLTVKFDGSEIVFDEQTNGTTLGSPDKANLNIYFKVVGNQIKVAVNSTEEDKFFGSSNNKYLVKNIGNCIAKSITFTATVKEGATASTLSFVSINQNYNQEGYNQTFELEDGKIKTYAKARIVVGESAYVSTQDSGYKLKAYKGTVYTYDFTAYSVLEKVSSGDLFIKEDDSKLWLSNEDKPKKVLFKEAGIQTFTVKDADTEYQTIEVEVLDKKVTESSNTAPVYKTSGVEDILKSYNKALQEATLKEYNGTKYCIRLGESIKLPSLQSLVFDDYTAFNDLKYTVYYRTPETTGTATKMEITTDKAGVYEFYVAFEDAEGQKMQIEDFYTLDENDSNVKVDGKYKDYVFTFEIIDNAPINVTAVNQSKGYIGTTYSVSKFNISASGYTPTYELYYNSDVSAMPVGDWESTWTLIPVASKVSENDTLPDGFDYEDIQNIGYDGQFTFTPDRVGKYVVKCTVSSTSSVRSASAVASVEVQEKPNVVTPVNPWFKENAWSLVFLSAGTVCLILVIILLFIKPKDKIEEED